MIELTVAKFASLGDITLLKWAVLFCAFVLMLVLLYGENRKARLHREILAQSIPSWLASLAIKRGWYIVVFFAIYILTIVSYDIKIHKLHLQMPTMERNPSQDRTMSATTNPSSQASPATQALQEIPHQKDPENPATQSAVVGLFENITTFSEENAQSQSHMDRLKQKYEQLLVTYYILEKCTYASVEQFQSIQDLILNDLRTSGGEVEILTKIVDASKGLYDEMYSRTDCKDPRMLQTKQQFDANLQRIKTLR